MIDWNTILHIVIALLIVNSIPFIIGIVRGYIDGKKDRDNIPSWEDYEQHTKDYE